MGGERATQLPRNDPDIEAMFDAAPRELVAEIMYGVLHLRPRPARLHTNVATNLGALVVPPFRFGQGGPGGWIILFEPELHVGPRPDKLVPDFAGWRRTRMPDAVGGEVVPAHDELAPDWICEVISPDGDATDRNVKMPIYAREGVSWVLLVDPVQRAIEAHRLVAGVCTLEGTHRGEHRARIAPFEAVELDLALLWSR